MGGGGEEGGALQGRSVRIEITLLELKRCASDSS